MAKDAENQQVKAKKAKKKPNDMKKKLISILKKLLRPKKN